MLNLVILPPPPPPPPIRPCWFSLNNSETVKLHFIGDIRAKFGIPNSRQSPDIRQNSYGAVSDFRISGQSLIKENCHNSRTSNDIDMKLGPVTIIAKTNKTTSKKIDDDLMSENCDTNVSRTGGVNLTPHLKKNSLKAHLD